MTARWEVDLDTERVLFDGSWLGRDEIAAKIQQMLASGDFKISRHSEALEYLAQSVGSVKTLTLKLSGEQYAKLEAAGQKLGKPAATFGRDLLLQVLGGAATASAPAPTPLATAPVIIASAPPPPVLAPAASHPPPVIAPARPVAHTPPPVASSAHISTPSGLAAGSDSDETPTLAVAAPIAAKRKESLAGAPAMPPPVMSPATEHTTEETAKIKQPGAPAGAPGDARRWFNRG